MRKTLPTLFLSALILAAASPASAATFELFGGYYFPEESLIDDGPAYGLRGSVDMADQLALELSASRFEADDILGFVDLELISIDVSAVFDAGADDGLLFFAGPGWAFVDANAFGFSASSDSLTAHAGLAFRQPLGATAYLRPDARARWFEDGGDIDVEVSIAVGWRF
jgi:hypothetical protein